MSQGLLYLQKIVWQLFSANRKSHTASKKLKHTEMKYLLSWMSEMETLAKKLFSHGERLIKNNCY